VNCTNMKIPRHDGKAAFVLLGTLLVALNTLTVASERELFIDDPSIEILDMESIVDDDSSASTLSRKPLRTLQSSTCSSDQALWQLTLTTDRRPKQTSWLLKDAATSASNNNYLEGPSPSQEYAMSTKYNANYCLDRGASYIFRIRDSGNNGLCCQFGQGGFRMAVDGKLVLKRDTGVEDDWSVKSFLFTVPCQNGGKACFNNNNDAVAATNRPTRRPTRRPTPRPTRRPTNRPVTAATPRPTPRPTPATTTPPAQEESGVAVSFILMGDIPYFSNEKYCLNKQLREINPATDGDFSFIVHVGDMKSGKTTNCVQEYYSDVADIFSHPNNALNYDTRDVFFLIGDNDWNDCNSPGTAYTYWMNNFGNGKKTNGQNTGANPNGFGTFSKSSMRQTLQYQDDGTSDNSPYYASDSTNFSFFINKVLFIGINQVGGSALGDESQRVANNFNWTKDNMAKYAQQGMKTVVVFAHAPMGSARWEYFGSPFQDLLQRTYPDILALYAHGDGHEFSLERVDRDNANLFDLECDGGMDADPLLISITRQGSNRDGLTVDRRGGRYSGGDCQPNNRDKTWSSNLF